MWLPTPLPLTSSSRARNVHVSNLYLALFAGEMERGRAEKDDSKKKSGSSSIILPLWCISSYFNGPGHETDFRFCYNVKKYSVIDVLTMVWLKMLLSLAEKI